MRPQRVIHLAAQAGVRYSLTHPHAYVDSNLVGFMNILEGCRHNGVEHLVYASSSSVYGANTRLPFSEHDIADHPLSLYAATKRSNELMAHCYAHLYGLPVSGLRFFTVYGPWGRPDMALFLFTRAILAGEPIEVFNQGHHRRDFTYIDDIVEGVLRVTARVAAPNPGLGWRASRSGHQPGAVSRLQHRQQPPGGAAALHRGDRGLSGQEGGQAPAAHAARATCRKPAPTSTTWARMSVTGRPRRSKSACAISSPGTAITTRSEKLQVRDRPQPPKRARSPLPGRTTRAWPSSKATTVLTW